MKKIFFLLLLITIMLSGCKQEKDDTKTYDFSLHQYTIYHIKNDSELSITSNFNDNSRSNEFTIDIMIYDFDSSEFKEVNEGILTIEGGEDVYIKFINYPIELTNLIVNVHEELEITDIESIGEITHR